MQKYFLKKKSSFTIVEMIVVIAVITTLAAIGIGSYSNVTRNARNTERKRDLKDLQLALEAMRNELGGTYPSTGGSANWRTSCAAPTDYIQGLAPNFIDRLPLDPRNNQTNPTSGRASCTTSAGSNCYYYTSDGTDYKLLANCTPEGTLNANDSFYDPRRHNTSLNIMWAWQVSSSVTPRGTTAGTGW